MELNCILLLFEKVMLSYNHISLFLSIRYEPILGDIYKFAKKVFWRPSKEVVVVIVKKSRSLRQIRRRFSRFEISSFTSGALLHRLLAQVDQWRPSGMPCKVFMSIIFYTFLNFVCPFYPWSGERNIKFCTFNPFLSIEICFILEQDLMNVDNIFFMYFYLIHSHIKFSRCFTKPIFI